MAITQAMCTSFKKELLEGKHDFSSAGHTFKIALYSAAATLSAGTTNFVTTGEVVGAGYTTGGNALVNVAGEILDPTSTLLYCTPALANSFLRVVQCLHPGLV